MARRFLLKAVTGALCAGVLAACTGPAVSSGAAGTKTGSGPANTLNMFLYQNPAGVFGPLAPASGPDIQVMSLIYEGLLGMDNNYKLQPEIASSYSVSPDATTFTFHLRSGLKWSDGKPLTSADVLFTYDLMANPKSGSATTANYTDVQGVNAFVAGKAKTISGFSAPDPDTFVIKATSPDYGLLALIGTVNILPKHILASTPVTQMAKSPFFQKPTVTEGPYKFVTYKPNQYVYVTANQYYRTPPKIKTIYLKTMTQDAATAALSNGDLDIASFTAADLPTVKAFKNIGIQQTTGAGFIRIALNQKLPYFKDVRVRQAFLYAINRKQIVNSILDGKGTVQNSDFFGPDTPSGINDYPYDPAKAKALLKAAGWDSNRTITLSWVPGQRDRDSAATIIQNELGAVGVKVKLHHDTAAEAADLSTSYQMSLYGGGNYATDPWSVNAITNCADQYPSGANLPSFCDPTLDKLMMQANADVNAAARKAMYDKAIIEDNKQVDEMWLYDSDGLWGVSNRVHGFHAPGAYTDPFWAPASWSLS